jgi:hypothetical protein
VDIVARRGKVKGAFGFWQSFCEIKGKNKSFNAENAEGYLEIAEVAINGVLGFGKAFAIIRA